MTQNNSPRGRACVAVFVALLMAALTLAFGHLALAAPRTGTITITQHDPNQKAIGGGKAAIYQVGVINGSSYQYKGDFASIGDDLTSHIPDDPDTGKVDSGYLDQLESIAEKSSSGPLETLDISPNGRATFGDLEPGAYLIVQPEPAQGYNAFDRFLVTIPWYGKDQKDPYNVDASPKLDPVTTPTSGNPGGNNPGGGTPSGNNSGTNPSGGTGTTTPASDTTPTAGGTLPQTGQLWWPVAALGMAGVALVVVGKRSNGKRAHES